MAKVKTFAVTALIPFFLAATHAFSVNTNSGRGSSVKFTSSVTSSLSPSSPSFIAKSNKPSFSTPKADTKIAATPADLDLGVVALVAGQENYGFAVVALGEAIWSFLAAPSLDHAKILVPAIVSALVLFLVSGPMITSGDPNSVALGLEIATFVSVGLGASYIARLVAPYSPSAKEIAFLGLLVAVAGFFSFSQNLVVDGFVTLPSLPSIPLPSLPSIELPSF